MSNHMKYNIDLMQTPPEEDTARQYYYIEKAKKYVQKESEEAGRPLTACITTFGCQMNARDSEKLRGILRDIGYMEAPEDEADFVIFNTCTVRENANTRVYGRLGQLKPHKKKNSHMKIGLCGCMMQDLISFFVSIFFCMSFSQICNTSVMFFDRNIIKLTAQVHPDRINIFAAQDLLFLSLFFSKCSFF